MSPELLQRGPIAHLHGFAPVDAALSDADALKPETKRVAAEDPDRDWATRMASTRGMGGAGEV